MTITHIQNLVIPNFVKINGEAYSVHFDSSFTFTPISDRIFDDIYFNDFLTVIPDHFLDKCAFISNVYIQEYISCIGEHLVNAWL